MNRRHFLHSTALTLSSITLAGTSPAQGDEPAKIQDLNEVLETIRKKHQLPALAAAVVQGNHLMAEGAVGVRQTGKEDKVTLDDRFMLGSCTKDMTVLLICRLIDAGKLEMNLTLNDALPGMKMRDDFRSVTLAQLLTFKGGIQPYTQIGPKITPILFEAGPASERLPKFIEHVLNETPIVKPGTAMRYSNASYILAAYVAAKKTQSDYQSLLAEHVFKPLKMTTAGFGFPRSKTRPNEPAFHVMRDKAYQAMPDMERPPEVIMAPAGGCHCSIRDFGKFAAYRLAAAQGKDPLLKPETVKRVREVLGQEFPGGGESFGGTPWLHAGCQVLPNNNLAVVVTTNCGAGDEACEQAFTAARKKLGLAG